MMEKKLQNINIKNVIRVNISSYFTHSVCALRDGVHFQLFLIIVQIHKNMLQT